MYTVNKQDAKQKEFILVRNRQTLEINKVLAPHELQVGVEGYKDSSLRVLGDQYIAGSLEIKNGARGVLKLPDGSPAIRGGPGILVSDGTDDTVTLSFGSHAGGIETLIVAGGGLQSSVNDGVLTLSVDESSPLMNGRSLTTTELVLNGEIVGTQDGQNTVFTLRHVPTNENSLMLWLNGQLLSRDSDYNVDGDTVTFANKIAPQSEDVVKVMYSRALPGGGIESLVIAGTGLTSSFDNGVLTLSLSEQSQLPNGRTLATTELVLNDEVTGPRNGSNTVFTLQHTPVDESSFVLWLNGQLLTKESDYTLDMDTITFINQVAPQPEDVIKVMYTRALPGGGIVAGSGLTSSYNSGILTMSLDTTGLALLSGATFTGDLVAQGGISGSLTVLADGMTPYLRAGTGISIVTGSNGQVEISTDRSPLMATELVLNGEISGVQDGSNLIFTLQHMPASEGSFMLWMNGQLMTKGSDYSLNTSTVTFANQIAPRPEDVIRVMYSRTIPQISYSLSESPAALQLSGDSLTGITMHHAPNPPGSLMLFLNGQLLTQGNEHDYTLSGSDVTFLRPFEPLDVIQTTYSYIP